MLDERTLEEPFIGSCTSEKLPWARVPARHSYAQFPPVEAYEGLAAGYAGVGQGEWPALPFSVGSAP